MKSGDPSATDLDSAQQLLLLELDHYRGVDEEEEAHRLHIRAAVAESALWWHRGTMPGHVTASVFVVDPAVKQILLHYHRKLDRWLQFGGHDDGEQSPVRTALRELTEESGLADFDFLPGPAIFDVDVHPIPAVGEMPAHNHLDIRFLVQAEPECSLRPAEGESEQLNWFALRAIPGLDGESGLQRVVRKLEALPSALSSS